MQGPSGMYVEKWRKFSSCQLLNRIYLLLTAPFSTRPHPLPLVLLIWTKAFNMLDFCFFLLFILQVYLSLLPVICYSFLLHLFSLLVTSSPVALLSSSYTFLVFAKM